VEIRPVSEEPRLAAVERNGLRLAVWDWPGAGPPVLFAHATGFHGRVWDQVARRVPGRRVLAIDFRGHGRSGKPNPPYRWSGFGDDLLAVAEELDLRGATGVGHSMGGHAMVSAAARQPAVFSDLLLVDPVIFPPEYYSAPPPDASFIKHRRAVWKSPEEMFERYYGRQPFAGWHAAVLRDYCRFGVLPEDGHYVLACPPAIETSIYAEGNAPEANLYPLIPGIRLPVTVLRADARGAPGVFDLSASPTWPRLAERFACGHDRLLTGRNHYIPMESPELVAAEIAAIAGLPPVAKPGHPERSRQRCVRPDRTCAGR